MLKIPNLCEPLHGAFCLSYPRYSLWGDKIENSNASRAVALQRLKNAVQYNRA